MCCVVQAKVQSSPVQVEASNPGRLVGVEHICDLLAQHVLAHRRNLAPHLPCVGSCIYVRRLLGLYCGMLAHKSVCVLRQEIESVRPGSMHACRNSLMLTAAAGHKLTSRKAASTNKEDVLRCKWLNSYRPDVGERTNKPIAPLHAQLV